MELFSKTGSQSQDLNYLHQKAVYYTHETLKMNCTLNSVYTLNTDTYLLLVHIRIALVFICQVVSSPFVKKSFLNDSIASLLIFL